MTTAVQRDGDTLTLTRTFNAPIEAVFKAWTEPEALKRWSGCAAATIVDVAVDLRVGGEFRQVMRIEGCGEYPMVATFTEIDPPNALAYTIPGSVTDSPDGQTMTMPETTTRATFRELGGTTEVTLTVTGLPEGPMQGIVGQGWQDSFEKLAAALEG